MIDLACVWERIIVCLRFGWVPRHFSWLSKNVDKRHCSRPTKLFIIKNYFATVFSVSSKISGIQIDLNIIFKFFGPILILCIIFQIFSRWFIYFFKIRIEYIKKEKNGRWPRIIFWWQNLVLRLFLESFFVNSMRVKLFS